MKQRHQDLAQQLWDALRLNCCATGLKAQRIVIIHKHDIERAVREVLHHETTSHSCPVVEIGVETESQTCVLGTETILQKSVAAKQSS